ncbi:MAG: biopolymer transporter ExbD [Elusimicrobia bacterium]|nr:biopolymer transporter ExbD [Elusimicrobiota bacterium]
MMDVRRRITTDSAIGGVNIVPVIDLCLVLLVILLVISPLMDRSPVEVTLPRAHVLKEDEENHISISVNPDGRLAVNSQELDLKDLERAVRNELKVRGSGVYVIIRADENVQYGRLNELIKIAKDAGATHVALGTREIEGDESTLGAEGATP